MENKHIITFGFIALAIVLVGLYLFQSNKTPGGINPSDFTFKSASASPTPIVVKELQMQDVKVGTGSAVVAGDAIVVNYIGALIDGKVFEKSSQPFELQIGVGKVIKGWDQGVLGMKVGGTRRLIIPADLAYGATGQGSIPPNAPLIFEIELLEIKPKDIPGPLNISTSPAVSPSQAESPTSTPTPQP